MIIRNRKIWCCMYIRTWYGSILTYYYCGSRDAKTVACSSYLSLGHRVASNSRIRKIIDLFAEYCLFYRVFLQKRPIILRSLLFVATQHQPTRRGSAMIGSAINQVMLRFSGPGTSVIVFREPQRKGKIRKKTCFDAGKIGFCLCSAGRSKQVLKLCADPDLGLLYILILGTYSKFARKNNFLALSVCSPQPCSSAARRFAASRSRLQNYWRIVSFPQQKNRWNAL